MIALFLMRRIGWIVFKQVGYYCRINLLFAHVNGPLIHFQVVYLREISSIKVVLVALLKGLALVSLLASFIWLIYQLYRTTSLTNILSLFLYP